MPGNSTNESKAQKSDAEFARELLDRMVDQHEATIGDEGVIHIGDEENFERFLNGLVELSATSTDPVVEHFEPTSSEEMAAVLVDRPYIRVVRIERDFCPAYVWYDDKREEFRTAIYDPDDERENTPALGDTGKLNRSDFQ